MSAAQAGAYFSPCRTWRYSLTRDVAPLTGEGTVTFVGLNPSTADETEDDPTIRRCIGFARRWGYARLKMVNLYAYRSTDPRALSEAPDPVGPENDHVLSVVFGGSDLIVAAWGAQAKPERVCEVMSWPIRPRVCLGLTKGGAPRHPLYVRADQPLVPYLSAAQADLGGGFSLRFTSWAPDRKLNPKYADVPDVDKAGAIIKCAHGIEGAILFDTMTDARGFAGRPRWKVESWEPLTLSPSIDAGCCHGFIREGRWVGA